MEEIKRNQEVNGRLMDRQRQAQSFKSKKKQKKSAKPCKLNKGIIRFATRFQKRNGVAPTNMSGSTKIENNARVAQLVEHDLAKVGVAGSNPVSRSKK